MRAQKFAAILAALLLTIFSSNALAAATDDINDDTDTQMNEAKVVEVTENHISVIARSGVEHVIAIDHTDTKFTKDGTEVSVKDLREGDIVTIELDAENPMKFAKNISFQSGQLQIARVRR